MQPSPVAIFAENDFTKQKGVPHQKKGRLGLAFATLQPCTLTRAKKGQAPPPSLVSREEEATPPDHSRWNQPLSDSEAGEHDASVVPAQAPCDEGMQLMLGDCQGRQPVVAVMTPHKPDKRPVRRNHVRISPDAAVAAVEAHDGKVCTCRSASRDAEC